MSNNRIIIADKFKIVTREEGQEAIIEVEKAEEEY